MNRSVAFKTLGCRLNQSETDSLASRFHHEGYRIVEFSNNADVYIINTCTVTNQSDKKSRNLISQVKRKKNNPVVVVTGCMVNNYRDIFMDIPGSVYYIENNRKSSIYSMIEAHFRGEIIQFEKFLPDVFNFNSADSFFHTRSMIKIQDGCDHYCAFCIVPFVRGRAVSRPVDDIIMNIRKITDSGFREIVITGVNIGQYKYGNFDFEDLIEKIIEIPGDFRVRVSSVEPDGFGDKFIRLFSHTKLMPHLHLCLQSGSDRILQKMRRPYTSSDYRSLIDKLKNHYTDFNFTTDIMVGFPGETEEDFEATCKAVREIRFSHVHTFKYSRRKGTLADRMPDQVPEKVKNERSEIIRNISFANKRNYRKSLIGKTQNVLVEKVHGKSGLGYGELYVPIEFRHPQISKNMMQEVTLTGLGEGEDPILAGKISNFRFEE
jgi:threonylcarbamoyladenosine tRNA methylthiotransferase MtaB